MPDASVGLAWGMSDEDWRDLKGEGKPDWLPETLKSARFRYVHVLLNGAPVWEATYAYADWGSGMGGCLPWPEPQFDEDVAAPKIVGWRASSWDRSLANLLTDLQGESDFVSVMDAERAGMTIAEEHPLLD